MSKPPHILDKEIIASSRIFNIERVRLRFENGALREFERLVSKKDGAVLIVPMLDDETLLLVQEYAVGVERYELGFPKGVIEPNEAVFEAANREMMEEIGYGSKDLKIISTMTTSPSYWGSVASVVLARNLYSASLPGDEPEPLEVIPWRLQDYRALLKHQNFTEARSIAALLLIKEMFS